MNSTALISMIALGGLLGMIGQGIRVIVGLKKANDDASDQKVPLKDVFDGRQLFLSLMVGFVSGAIANILLDGGKAGTAVADSLPSSAIQQHMLGLIAAGYAGADFIEGFAKRRLTTLTKKIQPAQAKGVT